MRHQMYAAFTSDSDVPEVKKASGCQNSIKVAADVTPVAVWGKFENEKGTTERMSAADRNLDGLKQIQEHKEKYLICDKP